MRDLRHAFAVSSTLLGWYRTALTSQEVCLELSTYLGHSNTGQHLLVSHGGPVPLGHAALLGTAQQDLKKETRSMTALAPLLQAFFTDPARHPAPRQ